MIQYAALFVRLSTFTAYWMPDGACHRARRRRDPVAGMTRTNDLTRPPRRTEGRARRQAARLFAQRRRQPRRVDLEDLSRRRRLRRHPVGNRCAGLCAGADARNLCRGHGQPERARRDQAGLRARQTCSMSAPGRARRLGRRPKLSRRCRISRCWIPTTRCARWRSASSPTAFACVTSATTAAKPAPR